MWTSRKFAKHSVYWNDAWLQQVEEYCISSPERQGRKVKFPKVTDGNLHIFLVRCIFSKSKCSKRKKVRSSLEVEMLKSACCCGTKHNSKSTCWKLNDMFGPLPFREVGARDCAPCQEWAKCKATEEVSTTDYNQHYTTLQVHDTSIIEGSLETKVPTIWTDEKQHSQEEAEPGRNSDV